MEPADIQRDRDRARNKAGNRSNGSYYMFER
jgi:hypothetical protein